MIRNLRGFDVQSDAWKVGCSQWLCLGRGEGVSGGHASSSYKSLKQDDAPDLPLDKANGEQMECS